MLEKILLMRYAYRMATELLQLKTAAKNSPPNTMCVSFKQCIYNSLYATNV